MEKIHLIGWALLLLVAFGSAATVFVNSEQEAMAAVNSGSGLEMGECKVLRVEKTVEQGENPGDKPVEVMYELTYFKQGQPDRFVLKVTVQTNSETAIKEAVETACRQKWEEIQADSEKQETTAVVRYTTGLVKQVYSLAENSWTAITTGQPGPQATGVQEEPVEEEGSGETGEQGPQAVVSENGNRLCFPEESCETFIDFNGTAFVFGSR